MHPKQPEALPAPYEFEPEVAEDFAAWMTGQAAKDAAENGGDTWTFKAVHDPDGCQGKSLVQALDDRGKFTGYWTFDPGDYRKKTATRKRPTGSVARGSIV